MKLTDNQLLILCAAGVSKSGALLTEIAANVSVANPKRACESLVKRGLMRPVEIKLSNQIGKGDGYSLTEAGEAEIGIEDAPAEEKAKPTDKTAARAMKKQIVAREIRGTEKRLTAIAEAGIMPPPPDFSAETHAHFREPLKAIIAAASKHDLEALGDLEPKRINCSSTIPLDRFRRMAIKAIDHGA
jgi:hypothetical protein